MDTSLAERAVAVLAMFARHPGCGASFHLVCQPARATGGGGGEGSCAAMQACVHGFTALKTRALPSLEQPGQGIPRAELELRALSLSFTVFSRPRAILKGLMFCSLPQR